MIIKDYQRQTDYDAASYYLSMLWNSEKDIRNPENKEEFNSLMVKLRYLLEEKEFTDVNK